MILHFTKHAKVRMAERKVTRSMILAAINKPDRFLSDGFTKTAIKRTKNKALLVVFIDSGSIKSIITVVLSSKVKKYLKTT